MEIVRISARQDAGRTHTGALQQTGVTRADALDTLQVDLVHPACDQPEVNAGPGGKLLPVSWGGASLEQVAGRLDTRLAELLGSVFF